MNNKYPWLMSAPQLIGRFFKLNSVRWFVAPETVGEFEMGGENTRSRQELWELIALFI